MAYETARRKYTMKGAAAYDLSGWDSTVRKPQRQTLPEDRPQARPQPKARPRGVLLTVVEFAAAAVVLLLVIFSQMKLYEVTSQVSALENQLAAVEEKQVVLRSEYNSSVDLAAIEEMAVTQFGMSRPTNGQIIYVNLSGMDRAEVLTETSGGFLSDVSQLFEEGFSHLGEYLS